MTKQVASAITHDKDSMSRRKTPQTLPKNKQQIINPKILWLRAFDTIYRPELALEIFKLIQEQYSEAELYMVGPDKGGLMAACKNYAAQNHLKVHFPGKLLKREWKNIAQDCSIFLNTSSIDNAPVSVSEAMAMGLVVVSANVGGMTDLLDHGRAGFLIDEPFATEDSRATQSHAFAFSALIMDLLKGRINPEEQILRARNLAEHQDWEIIHDLWARVLTQNSISQ
jgi:glycosyltransferase involved in cell wall biosynthesis